MQSSDMVGKYSTLGGKSTLGAGQRKKSRAKPLANPRDLSGVFSEHTWALEQTSFNYTDSNVDVKHPQLSKGET